MDENIAPDSIISYRQDATFPVGITEFEMAAFHRNSEHANFLIVRIRLSREIRCEQ